MHSIRLHITLFSLILSSVCFSDQGQKSPPSVSSEFGELKGRVTDFKTGQGIPGATVFDHSGMFQCTTDDSGYYHAPKVLSGTYDVASKSGRWAQSGWTSVSVQASQTSVFNPVLKYGVPVLKGADTIKVKSLSLRLGEVYKFPVTLINKADPKTGDQVPFTADFRPRFATLLSESGENQFVTGRSAQGLWHTMLPQSGSVFPGKEQVVTLVLDLRNFEMAGMDTSFLAALYFSHQGGGFEQIANPLIVNIRLSIYRIGTLGKFRMAAPEDKAKLSSQESIEFEWTASEEASWYRFELSSNTTFSTVDASKLVLSPDHHLILENLDSGKYFWRVWAFQSHRFGLDSQVVSGNFRQILVGPKNGKSVSTLSLITKDLSLQNFPNPFNPQTTISLKLPKNQKASLRIFNIQGQLVWQEAFSPKGGFEQVVWQGVNQANCPVASGIYLYTLSVLTPNGSRIVKQKSMVLLK